MQVVLQPSANKESLKHYEDTIENPVDLNMHRNALGELLYQHLTMLFPIGFAAMWGVTPGVNGVNAAKWERIELGAAVLFTAKGRIYGRGVVAARFRNKSLAKELWGVDGRGETWEYMYALAEITPVDIPYAAFNDAVGYKSNNVIQGFTVMDEMRSGAFLDAFPLALTRVEWPEAPDVVERALRSLDGDLERRVESWQRAEQSVLREALLHGAATGRCMLCDRVMDARMLVAAHIKKRSHCTDTEKSDLDNIGMLNCRFGCDELYERGFVTVDADWSVLSKATIADAVIASYIAGTMATKVAPRPSSAAYFAWHRKYHGF